MNETPTRPDGRCPTCGWFPTPAGTNLPAHLPTCPRGDEEGE